MNHLPELSIDTSFLGFDDWSSDCPSPLSSASSISTPATPSSYMNSPYPDYGTYTLDSLEHSLAKAFGNEFPMYQNNSFMEEYTDADSPSAYPSYEHCLPKFHAVTPPDLDFSAFIASLPEYSL